jgi:hypothetical protein
LLYICNIENSTKNIALRKVYTLHRLVLHMSQGPELHMDKPGQQEALLLLDLYTLQGLSFTWKILDFRTCGTSGFMNTTRA